MMVSILLPVLGLLLLIAIAGLSLMFHSLQIQKDKSSSLQEASEELRGRLESLVHQYDGLVSDLKKVVRGYERLLDRCRALEAQLISNRSYDNAIRMVKSGAKLGELVEVCGLSPGEAKLVAALHQSRATVT